MAEVLSVSPPRYYADILTNPIIKQSNKQRTSFLIKIFGMNKDRYIAPDSSERFCGFWCIVKDSYRIVGIIVIVVTVLLIVAFRCVCCKPRIRTKRGNQSRWKTANNAIVANVSPIDANHRQAGDRLLEDEDGDGDSESVLINADPTASSHSDKPTTTSTIAPASSSLSSKPTSIANNNNVNAKTDNNSMPPNQNIGIGAPPINPDLTANQTAATLITAHSPSPSSSSSAAAAAAKATNENRKPISFSEASNFILSPEQGGAAQDCDQSEESTDIERLNRGLGVSVYDIKPRHAVDRANF